MAVVELVNVAGCVVGVVIVQWLGHHGPQAQRLSSALLLDPDDAKSQLGLVEAAEEVHSQVDAIRVGLQSLVVNSQVIASQFKSVYDHLKAGRNLVSDVDAEVVSAAPAGA